MCFVCKRVEWCCMLRLSLLLFVFVCAVVVQCVCALCGVLCEVVGVCCCDIVLCVSAVSCVCFCVLCA